MKYVIIALILLISTVAQAQDIGRWKDDTGGSNTDITLYKSGGVYHLKQVFSDGSKRDVKVNKSGSKYRQSGAEDYYFINNGVLQCYDRQGLVYEARPAGQPKVAQRDTSGGESCYAIGVKFGRCATLSMKGKSCNPSDDIAVPPRCQGNADTQRGIEAGTRSVY